MFGRKLTKNFLNHEVQEHIKKIVLAMGFDDGNGDVYINWDSPDMECDEEGFEVSVCTYYSSTSRDDDHIHCVKIPWKYLFNMNFKQSIAQDKKEAEEIAELKRLQKKYPTVKVEN